MYFLIGFGIVVLVFLIMLWVIYNGLVSAQNIVEEGFSGIDVQLKKRFELIPNLIEAVKGYNAHEAKVLQEIVEHRSRSSALKDVQTEDQSITTALRSFRIHVEDYPDLQANTQFLKLMDNLSQVENELAMARRYFNGTIRDYNTKIEVFPAVMFASSFGFKPMEFYEIDDNEKIAPEVNVNS
jgi:LemA protein